jgi:hypothetical protein
MAIQNFRQITDEKFRYHWHATFRRCLSTCHHVCEHHQVCNAAKMGNCDSDILKPGRGQFYKRLTIIIRLPRTLRCRAPVAIRLITINLKVDFSS